MWKRASDNHQSGNYHSDRGIFSRHKRPPYLATSRTRSSLFSRSAADRTTSNPIGYADSARLRSPSGASTLSRHANHYVNSRSTADSTHSQLSFNSRSGRPMAGLMDTDRARSRRERTFVGSECAVCEEPLEHTLRGERVLQFSCGHVSHEACFYEYIREFEGQYCPTCNAPLGLDTSRGGNVLDIEKLSNIVRSVASDAATQRSGLTTPTTWDHRTGRESASGFVARAHNRDSREIGNHRERVERLTSGSRHHHQDDNNIALPEDFDSQYQTDGRRHDYDVQSMESDLSHRMSAKNPIPAPIVSIRSEFPTLNRSRQQQSLACLITVEVPEGSWRPDVDDLRHTYASQLPFQDEPYSNTRLPTVPESRTVHTARQENLSEIADELQLRVDNWHGLEFQRFGKLRLHGRMSVGKDRNSWQELECYLFAEMLICVKEKKHQRQQYDEQTKRPKPTRCTLKGSILIKRHLKSIDSSPEEPVLALNLSVNELPCFYLRFQSRNQLEIWRRLLLDLHPADVASRISDYDVDNSVVEEGDFQVNHIKRHPSINSSYEAARSSNTGITDYTNTGADSLPSAIHIPLDITVVIPVSSSMQGLKITLLRDSLKFLVHNLGPRDRLGLVTFGSSCGGVPLIGMTSKSWTGWNKILSSIRPVGQKSLRADVVEGANVAMDLLMQRKSTNPVSTILLVSDSSTSDTESVDFVVSRAEAAKISIHSFGLGLTHKPDTMIELSTRTKGSYVYVKDWMMLRDCMAGCLGALQTTSHQNVKLKLHLPEGSPAKFVKISGALHTTKRATGKDAEAALGDMRFGEKRDVLVQLAVQPDNSVLESMPQDPWESLVSGLEALGGGADGDEQRVPSVEEVPLIQADLTYGDLLRDGHLTHSPRPSLLTITVLPPNPRPKSSGRNISPPIPPHPSIVQRRMELLTSDMLTRALTLVSRGQHDRAQYLLTETRGVLKGLCKGSLPPLPPGPHKPTSPSESGSKGDTPASTSPRSNSSGEGQPLPLADTATIASATAVDSHAMAALDTDLESALEWINHPAVFGRDSRKAVLQSIGVISSQRAFTFRTLSESYWAQRVHGVKRLMESSQDWREAGDDSLTEE